MSDERERLRERQDEIVRALIDGAAIPDGFDPRAIDRARALLAQKRAWVEGRRARARPSLIARIVRALRTR